ncbi:hypothetical protein Tco_0261117 [Tanacetum coccineum]
MLEKNSYIPWRSYYSTVSTTSNSKKHSEADIDAMNAILLGIPDEIYYFVDACKTAQAMWQRVRRLMLGTYLSKQEMTSRLIDEFDKFKGLSGESIESYYSRLSKIMNDLERNDALPNILATSTKFLNSLQPEWSEYVTMVCQLKNLHVDDYDQLYDNLRQNENNVNASRAKRASRTHDPLVFNEPMNSLTKAMMLLAKAITQHYSTLTNIYIRASLNIRNQAYVQDGRIDVQSKNVSNAGRNMGRVFGNSGYSRNAQHVTRNSATVERIPRTSTNARDMSMVNKDEAGIALNKEENEFLLEDVNDE